MTSAAPLPSLGQIAPKIEAEAVGWSFGAVGRVPRLAQRRVILFFWPTRASSAKPDFYGGGLDAFFMPDRRQALRETFLKSSIAPAAWA